MEIAPSILLLDDGELDRVQKMLEALRADFVRLKGPEIRRAVELPRDLLITSGKRALNMPDLTPPADAHVPPTWVCLHNQDFLPLRQRLRELGVHFLVHAALGQESLRLFLMQLLYLGAERRSCLRLPLGSEVSYQSGADEHKATLAELSRDMCRVLSTRDIEPGAVVTVCLPANLNVGQELEIQARAIRSVECEGRSGEALHSVVLRFDGDESVVLEQIEAVVSGERMGTRLTPLAEMPERQPERADAETHRGTAEPSQPETSTEGAGERRREPRRKHGGQVQAFASFDDDAPQLAFGCDISVGGIRIRGHSGVGVGSALTLAIYGDQREEPLLVEGTVVRDEGEQGIALRFESVTPGQSRQLQKLSGGRPCVESLSEDEREDSRVVISRVLPRSR